MADKNNRKEWAYSSLTGFRRAIPIILVALASFTGLCFIMQDTGALGKAISNIFLGLFSIGGYFIPVLLLVHAFFYASDVQKKRNIVRVIFNLLALVTFSTAVHAISYFKIYFPFAPSEFYKSGVQGKGGGLVGGAVAFFLTKVFGTVGLIIIAVLILALYVTYFVAGGKSGFSRLLLKLLTAISDMFASFDKKKADKRKKQEEKRETRRREQLAEKQEPLFEDDFFAADNGMKELTISELGINEVRDDKELERNPKLMEKVFRTSEDGEIRTNGSESDAFYKNTEAPKRRVNMDYSTTDSVYGFSVSVEDAKYVPSENDILYEDVKEAKLDESAEDVFGTHFDPFDLKLNRELTNKPSSKAVKDTPENDEGISEFATPVSEITAEAVEKARQRADFEMKKRAALEAQRKYAEAQEALAREKAERVYTPRYTENTYTETEEKTPYIPEYMKEDEKADNSVYSYEEETVEDETPVFKPYVSPSAEVFAKDIQTKEETAPAEELKITRTMLDPTPSVVEEYGESEEEQTVTENIETDFGALDFEEGDGEEETELSYEEPEDDSEEVVEIPESEQNEQVKEYRKMFSFLNEEKEDEKNEEDESTSETVEDSVDFEEEEDEETEDAPPFVFTPPVPKPQPKEPEVKPEHKKPDYSDYQFPPLDLLIQGKQEVDPDQEEEKNSYAEKLVDTLLQFNVRISIKGIDRGPRITRYEIVPAKGVKVSSITNLFNDIALNLAAEGIRMEAPIPGKSAIGVEIPNKKPSMVYLRDLVESDEFSSSKSKTLSCLGKDVTGNPVFADIAKMPHILVAGATGMGKSVCINSILISILYKAKPDEVKFIMIDPKKVEFNGYKGIPHLLIPVVTDVKQAAGALMWAVEQMEKRYDLMEKLEVKNLDTYNEMVKEDPSLGEPMPKIIIVIDELNDIMLQVRKPAEDLIMSIAQKARAAGIHLIIGTQRPSVDVITGVIKANIPSRISCKVASYNDSKTILEQAGAEKLLNNGDMLYIPAGAPKALRVQGAFVSDKEVSSIMKFLKSQVKGDIYDEQALEDINRAAQKCTKGKGGADDFDDDDGDEGANTGVLNDQQFLDAVELAVKSGKIATSLIQRKISIGYGKAAKFIDIMEEMGIVSEQNGQRPRDVLITRDEWHEMLARRSLD